MDHSLAALIQSVSRVKDLTPQTEKFIAHLAALHAGDVADLKTSVHHGEESKQVDASFPQSLADKWEKLEVTSLADIQWGHRDCKIKSVYAFRDWVLAEPFRFVVLVGDMVDAAHAFTPGTPFDNLFRPQSQLFTLAEIFAPMRHRILGYVGGNHERRTVPAFGDLGTLIAMLLRIPYSGGRQLVRIKFGKHNPFPVMLWHGHPRARTKGALAQIMDRYMQIGNAKVYFTGHNHQSLVLPSFREVHEQGRIRMEKYVGMSGTSFLETYGSYGEWMGFGGYDVLMPTIRLEKSGQWEAVVR